MGAGRFGLWAPVLVGHVVYLVHFGLVILGQKKIGQQFRQQNWTKVGEEIAQ